jgi:hypothetical protein
MRPSLFLFTFVILLPSLLHGQSISGNLNSGRSGSSLGFGNVDIYRGDDLVASVLTDRYGNFNVRLDTGMYRCVVSYDGYATSTRMVHVKADESVDLVVAKEKGAAAGRPRVTESRIAAAPAASDHMSHTSFEVGGARHHSATPPSDLPATFGHATPPRAAHGVLTAGEVNDFAKWTQWTDLSEKTLSGLRDLWGIAPTGRHTLDLQTRNGLPVADALVRLLRKDGTVLYQARTDNTGKAELWSSLDSKAETEDGQLRIDVEHGGRTFRVDRAKPFTRAVNRLVLDVPCGPSDLVDVAFVVDATGSMQDEIDFLKAEMNDIIYRSKRIGDQLNFRFANVFYRDVGAREAYTTRSMDFTRVLSTAVNFISEQKADGGGDTPEAVEVALDSAINRLSWSPEARARVIFLVLDAGPHINRGVEQRMVQLAREAAAKGIRIVPVAASGTEKSTEYLLRAMALATNGTYTFLTDHSGVGSPHMEPSTDRFAVESLNDVLVRVLKSFTYMPDCDQQLPELELAYPDSIVTMTAAAVDTTTTPDVDPLTTSTSINWSYYPNPTTGLLNITADADITELHITDLSGKVLQLVKGLKRGEVRQLDLGGYATGIYLLRCPVGANWVSGKVVLQR